MNGKRRVPDSTTGKRNIRGLGADERGSSLVSFAFIAPLFILMIIGTIDMGRAYWTSSTLDHAAREAARYASIRGVDSDSPATDEQVANFAVGAATGLGLAPAQVTVSWDPEGKSGDTVTVEITHGFSFFVDGLIPLPDIDMNAKATRTVF